MEEKKLNSEFLEKLMLKAMLVDDFYVATLATVFKPDYIDDEYIKKCYSNIIDHYKEYNKIPPRDLIIHSYPEDEEKIKIVIDEVDSIDYDVAGNFDHLFTETDKYLREQAFKDALMKGVDLIEKKENPIKYKKIMEEALSKTLKIDLGVNYFGDMQKRLKKILSQTDIRIPSFYPTLDEFVSGGFPIYTLSVFLSRIHGYKCVGKDTKIKIRKKSTNAIFYLRIEDIWNSFINKNWHILKEGEMITLEKMKEKYGEVEGEKRYNIWKENISKSSKGRNTLNFFIKKYGEAEGEKRYKLYIQRQKESHSEKGYIKKYGEKKGKEKWEKRMKQLKHTTSLEGFVGLYGEVEGRKRWEERNRKWQETLKNKPQEEIDRINRNKKITIENQIKKHGEAEGRKRYIETMEKRYNKGFQRSEPELRLCSIIKKQIPGVFVKNQVFLGDKYFVDIIINDTHCIELFGDYWHCNPKVYESSYYHSLKEKKAKDVWKEDKKRIDFLEKLGYYVMVIWENDLNLNESEVIKKIKKFIGSE